MRWTKGVWLSVTPTRDYLVVAMIFEGMLGSVNGNFMLIRFRRSFY
jgi:hypothetical protein